VLVLTFGLIVLGALVRAHEAGLACPDWPLCFGEFVPEFDLRVGFEYSHRVLAGSVSLLFAGLAGLAAHRPAARRACAGLLAAGAALLVTQILLGALTVWKQLAAWTVTAHLLTGNAFALVLLATALALADAALGTRPAAVPRAARPAVTAAAGLLLVQVALGGLVASRYAGLVCPEWPACRGGVWFPAGEAGVGLHLLHRWNAVALVAALAAAAAAGSRGSARLRRATRLALALGAAQIPVGVANVLLRLPVEVTGLHSALAAALVLATTAAAREVWRRDKPAPAVLQESR
jgi:heme A synthase